MERANQNFLRRYAGASHAEFLAAAYGFYFQRGLDEAGYNEHLIELHAGRSRADLARVFLESEEFQKTGAAARFRLDGRGADAGSGGLAGAFVAGAIPGHLDEGESGEAGRARV